MSANTGRDTYEEQAGLRRSDLFKLVTGSPEQFHYYMEHKDEEEAGPALVFGILVHSMVEHDGLDENEIAVMPKLDRRTKAGKEAAAEFEANAAGKLVVSQEQADQAAEMLAALHKHPEAERLLFGADVIKEQPLSWVDEASGVLLKAKPDAVTETDEGARLIVDYKTTESVADGHFERSARKFGYDFQAAYYTEGWLQTEFEDAGFTFVAQEKTAPYSVRVYHCKPSFISQGRRKMVKALALYQMCEEANEWPGYSDEDLYGDEF